MSAPRPTYDAYFLGMLELVAARSTCVRRAVGAIVVDESHHILSTGHNGVPSRFPHCTDTPCPGATDPKGDTRNCFAVHAEANALLQCSRLDLAHTLYTSCAPCFECAKLITNTPIRYVIYRTVYSDARGVNLLDQLGISCSFKL